MTYTPDEKTTIVTLTESPLEVNLEEKVLESNFEQANVIIKSDYESYLSLFDKAYFNLVTDTTNSNEVLSFSLAKTFEDKSVALDSAVTLFNKGAIDYALTEDFTNFRFYSGKQDSILFSEVMIRVFNKGLLEDALAIEYLSLNPEKSLRSITINTDTVSLNSDKGVLDSVIFSENLITAVNKGLIDISASLDVMSIVLNYNLTSNAAASEYGSIYLQNYFNEDYILEDYVVGTKTLF